MRTQLQLEAVTSRLGSSAQLDYHAPRSTFRAHQIACYDCYSICKQVWLCLCRWLGTKIPVLWHQPGRLYLFEGGTVHSLSEDQAIYVSSCLTESCM